jgi:hypothetical protein
VKRGGPKLSTEEIILGYIHRAELIKNLLARVAPEKEITGLEIGVWLGDLLLYLLKQMPEIKRLYGIDSWRPSRLYGKYRSMSSWDSIYEDVKCSFLGKQVTIIRGWSREVIGQVPNGLHFVEIDGDHSYEQVRVDLEICEPKVVPGGLFCGHDYYGVYSPGVKRAVDEFAVMKGKEVHSKGEDVGTWWWYKEK